MMNEICGFLCLGRFLINPFTLVTPATLLYLSIHVPILHLHNFLLHIYACLSASHHRNSPYLLRRHLLLVHRPEQRSTSHVCLAAVRKLFCLRQVANRIGTMRLGGTGQSPHRGQAMVVAEVYEGLIIIYQLPTGHPTGLTNAKDVKMVAIKFSQELCQFFPVWYNVRMFQVANQIDDLPLRNLPCIRGQTFKLLCSNTVIHGHLHHQKHKRGHFFSFL